MSYLHKYDLEGKKIYVLSDAMSKPSGSITLRQKDWEGRALGRYNTVMSQLEKLKFTKEDKPEEEPEEMEAKKAAIAGELDDIASGLEADGLPIVALAIDKISDFLNPTRK